VHYSSVTSLPGDSTNAALLSNSKHTIEAVVRKAALPWFARVISFMFKIQVLLMHVLCWRLLANSSIKISQPIVGGWADFAGVPPCWLLDSQELATECVWSTPQQNVCSLESQFHLCCSTTVACMAEGLHCRQDLHTRGPRVIYEETNLHCTEPCCDTSGYR
jgi:hypothetical protein